jgi:hypothetical protein
MVMLFVRLKIKLNIFSCKLLNENNLNVEELLNSLFLREFLIIDVTFLNRLSDYFRRRFLRQLYTQSFIDIN